MPKRAFIVAIEKYALMQEGLSKTLPRTHEHALAFRDWLLKDLGLAAYDIFFCTEDPSLAGRTCGATRKEIQTELSRLKKAGKDQTEDLFFYFSGHGFSYVDVDGNPSADILLAADYVSREVSGDCCLKLDEIEKWLKMCLGTVTSAQNQRPSHYYFIDACRNEITEDNIKVATLGLTYEVSGKRKPPVFTLYSATTGAMAAVGSPFPEILIDGLHGNGRAKCWYHDTFAVLFDSLTTYLEQRLETQLDPRTEGGGDGVIRTLAKELKSTCVLTVRNAGSSDEFQVEIKNRRELPVSSFSFTGSSKTFNESPDDYLIRVVPAEGAVEPAGPVLVDLYENRALNFTKVPQGPTGRRAAGGATAPLPAAGLSSPAAAAASVTVLAPNSAEVVVRSETVDLAKGSGVLSSKLWPGIYTVETRDMRGALVRRHRIDVMAGDNTIDLRTFETNPLRESLLRGIKGNHFDGAVDFSETLGPTPDQGMDLWLALVGAARIVGRANEFSKLGPLPLASFEHVTPGAAPIYVLAGMETPHSCFRASLSSDWQSRPSALPSSPHFPGLFELLEDLQAPAYRFLTVQVDEMAALTVGVCSLPNRATLVTVSHDAARNLRVQQFILPLQKLQHLLPNGAGLGMSGSGYGLGELSQPLPLIRRCVEVQRAFERYQDLSEVLTSTQLDSLLHFKWFEPVVALLAAYELVRRGEAPMVLSEVVRNLRDYFSGLPDNEALASLAKLPFTIPASAPLVLEGLQALNLTMDRTGAPPAKALVFRGPWTAWRGVVKPGLDREHEVRSSTID